MAKGTAIAKLPEGAELLPIGPETSKIGFIGSKVTGSHKGGFNSFTGSWALVADQSRGQPDLRRDRHGLDLDGY